jgi:hypothetical protein
MKFIRIPEEAIHNAAIMMEQIDGGHESNFNSILDKIAIFKQAEMTPIVLMDPTNYTVYVVSEETFMKKLH